MNVFEKNPERRREVFANLKCIFDLLKRTCWAQLPEGSFISESFYVANQLAETVGSCSQRDDQGIIDTVNTVALNVDQWFNLKISVWIPYNPMSSPTRPKKPWRSTSFWWFQRILPTVRGSVLNHLTKFKREQRVSVIHIFHLQNLALVKWFLLCSLDVSLKPDFWRLHCFNFKTFFVHFVLIIPLSIWMGGTC